MIRSALLFWSLPVVAAFAAPGDYHSTTRYGVYANSRDSLLFEPVITAVELDAETTEPDGRKRLSFHFTLHNPSAAYFEARSRDRIGATDYTWCNHQFKAHTSGFIELPAPSNASPRRERTNWRKGSDRGWTFIFSDERNEKFAPARPMNSTRWPLTPTVLSMWKGGWSCLQNTPGLIG